jgi:murein DD-endopeptidase MepM/ murein hydrolase activator NlpD
VDYRGSGEARSESGGPRSRAAPIEQRAVTAEPPLTPRPHPETPAPDWADGPGVPLSAFALQPEEAQPYDPAAAERAHRVAPGETLYTIASRRQIPLRALIDQNGLRAPFRLESGQVLALPPPRVHRVQRGETLSAIGRRYNIDLRSLALLNRLSAPYTIQPGDALILPALARPVETAAPAAPAPTRAPSTTPAPPPRSAPAGSARFAWPLQGQIVSNYGALPDGRRSDGVEIAAPVGAPIRAAGDGVVVYAGGDLPAYGQLVLIRHADGYVTAYAYAQRVSAQAGRTVRAGEAIGEVGPGRDGPSRLLFQVRRGADPIDPTPLLPAP